MSVEAESGLAHALVVRCGSPVGDRIVDLAVTMEPPSPITFTSGTGLLHCLTYH